MIDVFKSKVQRMILESAKAFQIPVTAKMAILLADRVVNNLDLQAVYLTDLDNKQTMLSLTKTMQSTHMGFMTSIQPIDRVVELSELIETLSQFSDIRICDLVDRIRFFGIDLKPAIPKAPPAPEEPRPVMDIANSWGFGKRNLS